MACSGGNQGMNKHLLFLFNPCGVTAVETCNLLGLSQRPDCCALIAVPRLLCSDRLSLLPVAL